MKIPFHIITGFLGAGKTTLLKRIIQQMGEAEKLGIVQNEFAPISIDAAELRTVDGNYSVMEVNNGSVFCVCRLSGFTSGLSDFISRYNFSRIILEASGLSDPSSLGEVLTHPMLSQKLLMQNMLCVVDGATFGITHRLVYYTRQQVMLSDVIIVNKADLLCVSQSDMERAIRVLNPFARIIFTCHAEADIPDLMHQQTMAVFPHGKSFRPDVNSMLLRSANPIKHENTREFFQTFASSSYRIKGVVKTTKGLFSVQCVMDEVNLVPLQEASNTQLVAISDKFTLHEFYNAYKKFS
jgi:G3E family GTPase